LYATGPEPFGVTVADVDLDGRPDILTANGAQQGGVSLLRGQADGTFAPAVTVATGSYTDAVSAADWNSDGKPDLVSLVATNILVTIYLGDGQGHFYAQETRGVGAGAHYDIQSGDFDRDGRPDFALVDYINNTVDVLLNHTYPGGGPNFPFAGSFNV